MTTMIHPHSDTNAIVTQWAKALPALTINLPIAAPPCPTCKHWKPTATAIPYNEMRPLIELCHSTPNRAFSCYEARSKQ